MTNNTAAPAPSTAHAHCTHPVTKVARARCRRERGAAYNTAMAARRIADKPRHVIEPCCCNGPVTDGVCTLCDRPVPATMTALGLLLTA